MSTLYLTFTNYLLRVIYTPVYDYSLLGCCDQCYIWSGSHTHTHGLRLSIPGSLRVMMTMEMSQAVQQQFSPKAFRIEDHPACSDERSCAQMCMCIGMQTCV